MSRVPTITVASHEREYEDYPLSATGLYGPRAEAFGPTACIWVRPEKRCGMHIATHYFWDGPSDGKLLIDESRLKKHSQLPWKLRRIGVLDNPYIDSPSIYIRRDSHFLAGLFLPIPIWFSRILRICQRRFIACLVIWNIAVPDYAEEANWGWLLHRKRNKSKPRY